MSRFFKRISSRFVSSRAPRIFFEIAALLAVAALLFFSVVPAQVRERMLLAVFPSAQRAYEYGNRHFSATKSSEYDIDRAELFFKRALALDSQLPYVHHQLARIAFLRGDFRNAMWHINKEIEMNRSPSASSYYVRGLIEGFRGNYEDSAKDYERYLESDPSNWAAINDYAWVLLKAHRFAEAAEAIEKGLVYFPENPWLLNSHAIALYELGRYDEALVAVQKAQTAVSVLSREKWLIAYPGNDPRIAELGVSAFKKAVEDNIHTIMIKVASGAVQ